MNPRTGKFPTRVRKELRELFSKEPHQTILFNTLLTEHYAKLEKKEKQAN